jgi:hypothetical protein
MPIITNPYKKSSNQQNSGADTMVLDMTTEEEAAAGETTATTPLYSIFQRRPLTQQSNSSNKDTTMGCSSNKRKGSTFNCKKIGGRLKRCWYRPDPHGGGCVKYRKYEKGAFHSIPHCIICVAKLRGVRIPHRAHHRLCPKSRKYKNAPKLLGGHQEEDTDSSLEEPADDEDPVLMDDLSSVVMDDLFNDRKYQGKLKVGVFKIDAPDPSPATTATQPKVLAKSIRDGVDKAMVDADADTGKQLLSKKNRYFSNPIAFAIAFIMKTIFDLASMKKKSSTADPLPDSMAFNSALQKFRTIFPEGQMEFEFPMDLSCPPSPYYESVQGEKLLYVDWKLMFPELKLVCYECAKKGLHGKHNCYLQHGRTNYSKDNRLFPIWDMQGRPSLAVVMNYECPHCSAKYAGNEGRLLATLPAYARNCYPVDPRFAGMDGPGTFHLHRDCTADLGKWLKTNSSATQYGELIHRRLHTRFERYIDSYLSRPGGKLKDPVKEDEYIRGFRLPSVANIQDYYNRGLKSPVNQYAYSYEERHIRELQQVSTGPEGAIAVDHTFEIMKNFMGYSTLALFTVLCSPTKEIALVLIVSSTAIDQVSHGLIQMSKRKDFKPGAVSYDTAPANEGVFQRIFGAVIVNLGLFHFLQRITDTLNFRYLLFRQALYELRMSVYEYDEEDLANVKRELANGTFDSIKYTPDDIHALMISKSWKFEKFCKKRIRKPEAIRQNLDAWIAKWRPKLKKDGSGIENADENGRVLFSNATEEKVILQKDHAEHIQDPKGFNPYREVEAPTRSAHGLPSYFSVRPESHLEKGHEFLAHVANGG